jgi:DNA topoisomerase IB
MTKNINRVPKKQWSKWSDRARVIFNRCYGFFMGNQDISNHPKAKKLPPAHWKTVAWNAAWIAADACDNTIPTEFVDV